MNANIGKVKPIYPVNPLIGVIRYEQKIGTTEYRQGYIDCEGCKLEGHRTKIEIGIVICPKCKTAFIGGGD